MLGEILKKYYPDAKCSLDFNTPFELLVATMLSAQCTDERVNKTTPAIFSKYSTPEDFANIDINEFGINSIIIKSHPTWLPKGHEEQAIKKILDLIMLTV